MRGAQNQMTIRTIHFISSLAQLFTILSRPPFFAIANVSEHYHTVTGKVAWVRLVLKGKPLGDYSQKPRGNLFASFCQFWKKYKRESVVEIGMGQHLTKVPGPFAKLSIIFRRAFADFRDKFPNLAEWDCRQGKLKICQREVKDYLLLSKQPLTGKGKQSHWHCNFAPCYAECFKPNVGYYFTSSI